ncbi:MAG: hypothetical protein AB7N99_01360 [Simkaniaceae bacterium]
MATEVNAVDSSDFNYICSLETTEEVDWDVPSRDTERISETVSRVTEFIDAHSGDEASFSRIQGLIDKVDIIDDRLKTPHEFLSQAITGLKTKLAGVQYKTFGSIQIAVQMLNANDPEFLQAVLDIQARINTKETQGRISEEQAEALHGQIASLLDIYEQAQQFNQALALRNSSAYQAILAFEPGSGIGRESEKRREMAIRVFDEVVSQLIDLSDHFSVDEKARFYEKLLLLHEEHKPYGGIPEVIAKFENAFEIPKTMRNSIFRRMVVGAPVSVGNIQDAVQRGKILKKLERWATQARELRSQPYFTPFFQKHLHEGFKRLQDKFEEAGYLSDFKPHMEKLSKNLGIQEEVQSSSFLSARSHFESASFSSSQQSTMISKKDTMRKPETLEQRKERGFQKIKHLIAGLDPSCPDFHKNVQEIFREIQLIKAKYPDGITSDFEALEKAVQILLNPQPLMVSKEEQMVLDHLGLNCGINEGDLQNYKHETEFPSILQLQRQMISQLKMSGDSLEALNNTARTATYQIEKCAIGMRYKQFVDSHPLNPPLNKHLPHNFPSIVIMVQKYGEDKALKEVYELWETLLTKYNEVSQGRFSQLLSIYRVMNPANHFEDFKAQLQREFIERIQFKQINNTFSIDFEGYLAHLIGTSGNHPVECFRQIYNEKFKPMHQWFLNNLAYIKVPYSQGSQKDTNLGTGVCINNSFNRLGILSQKPKAAYQTLPMGSTEKTRALHARLKLIYQQVANQTMTEEEAWEEQMGTSENYGIRLEPSKNKKVLESSLASLSLLAQSMVFYAREHSSSFLFLMSKEGNGGGHAINVQIDENQGIFRIMDDNVGLIEYPDLQTFQEQVGALLELKYSKYDTFQFRIFNPA